MKTATKTAVVQVRHRRSIRPEHENDPMAIVFDFELPDGRTVTRQYLTRPGGQARDIWEQYLRPCGVSLTAGSTPVRMTVEVDEAGTPVALLDADGNAGIELTEALIT